MIAKRGDPSARGITFFARGCNYSYMWQVWHRTPVDWTADRAARTWIQDRGQRKSK